MVAGSIKPGDVVLVKGSRGVRTEKVIERLLERFPLAKEGQAVNYEAEKSERGIKATKVVPQ